MTTRTAPALEGIIAAIPTPFDEDEALALDSLESNLARWNQTPLAGYAVLGTTGEFVSLTLDEKKQVLERARQAIPEHKLYLAGTGCESTRETVVLTRWASAIGADHAIVVTPHYNRRFFSREALFDHYRRVADESAIPVVIYHIPSCTGLALEPETVARIAEHENVSGIKDSSGDVFALQEMRRLSREDFSVLTGSVEILLAALTVGAQGAILADACVVWEPCVELQRAFRAGDLARARSLQLRLVPFNRILVGKYGIAGLKALLERMDFYGGPPRRPLESAPEDAVEELVSALEAIAGEGGEVR